MILLLGGTSETKPIAEALAANGWRIIASTATGNELNVGDHPNIIRRMGRLNEDEMASLIQERGIRLLLDSSHPYAAALHETAFNAARRTGIPYLRFERPRAGLDYKNIVWAPGHSEGAETAFSFGGPVLLTTGSRNLEPYVRLSRERGIPVIVRVLPHPESEEACVKAGLSRHQVIAERGPFTVDENLAVIRKFNIATLVTKDSGGAGGVAEKIEAARLAGCHVVIIDRPPAPMKNAHESVESVVAAARDLLAKG